MVSNSSQDFVASSGLGADQTFLALARADGLGDYQKFLALARDLGWKQKIHARRWKRQ